MVRQVLTSLHFVSASRRAVLGLVGGLTFCLLASPLVAETTWPGLRGPNFDGSVQGAQLFQGAADGEATPALDVAWKMPLGSGYSSVVVEDGRVFTMFAAGEVDVLGAFDTSVGAELWRYTIGETYAGHDGSHDGPISTPLIDGSKVYGLGAWGHLFALDATTGKELWATHLVDDHEAKKPHYGFTTSPLVSGGRLIVQMGAGEGKALAGFNAEDGSLIWSLGDDEINYHSPVVVTLGGREQVVSATQNVVVGVDGASGDILWSYEHGGDERAMGGATIVPLEAGDGRLFLLNKIDSSVMLQVAQDGGDWKIEELWSNNNIKSSYVVPVYHDGFLYGMSGRIFTSVDAASGERAWRSREPGDGFPTLVGDHLVVSTKPGSLHVLDASSQGYNEVTSLQLFDEHTWSTVAYADGSLYARSMGHLARIDPVMQGAAEGASQSWLASTAFGGFLDSLHQAEDKAAHIDAWMKEQATFPIVEAPGVVHFVYRGEAEDVGIVGDMVGFRREDPMQQVPGTDFYYYSTQLEPDAAVAYGFIVDYADPVADPLNEDKASGLFGDVSWLAMPAWQGADFLGESDAPGRLETFTWESKALEGASRTAEIYLPADYDAQTEQSYQVAYLHGGQEMLENGQVKAALDNLLGSSVEPLIAVFIHPDAENPRQDQRNGEAYLKMVVEELVPHVDKTYRTVQDRMGRAMVGVAGSAGGALMGAFQHPDLFGKVAIQSAMVEAGDIADMVPDAGTHPMVIYQEWGTYHLRSPHEAWSMVEGNRGVQELLRERGFRPTGGEVPEGFTWQCWKARTDDWLRTLFPKT